MTLAAALPATESEGFNIVFPSIVEEPPLQSHHPLSNSASHSGGGSGVRSQHPQDRAPRRRRRNSNRVLAWKKGQVIGQGGFGTVYRGLDCNTGRLLAGKEFDFDCQADEQLRLLDILEREISTMKDLSHPNIVQYVGADRIGNCFYIFMEYVPGGSLRSALDEFGAQNLKCIANFTRQIVLGLQYLHRHQVIHRDIKAANVLINVDGVVKLADFGSAQTFSEGRGMHGTPYWMAPEVIRAESVGWQSDIWSLGCVVVEMFTGLRPFAQFDNPVRAMHFLAASQDPVPLPDQCTSEAARDFLILCFSRDPAARPSATTLLAHPFLSGDQSNLASFSASDRMLTSANEEAFPEELRSALTSRVMMSVSAMNPMRVSSTEYGSAAAIIETIAATVQQESQNEIVEAVLDPCIDSRYSDEEEEGEHEGEVVPHETGESDSDEFCTNQRKAQMAIFIALLVALAVLSTILGLKT